MNKFLIISALVLLVRYSECLEAVPVNLLYKSNAVFDCASAKFSSDDIEFYRVTKDADGQDVEEKIIPYQDENQKDKVAFDRATMTLFDLRRPEIEADYVCKSKLTKEELKFVKQIQPFLMHPERLSQTVTENGFVEFECEVLYGNDTEIEWTWTLNEETIESNGTEVQITKNQGNSVLFIKPVLESHRGNIVCDAKNKFGSHSNQFNLRVKNTFAALWPFLGIVAEVLILCVIILIYEKKYNKKNQDTSAVDNEQAENLMGKESHGDLKKRNPKA